MLKLSAPQLDAGKTARLYKAYIIACVIIFPTWILIHPYGFLGLLTVSDYLLTINAVAAGIIAIAAGLSLKAADRWSWILIGVGIICWGLGMIPWTYYRQFLNQTIPLPSAADIGFLMLIPPVFWGLITMPAGGIAPEERIKIGLDSLIAVTGLAALSWFFILEPIYTHADVSLPTKVVGIAYPAGDIMLLSALISGIARGWLRLQSGCLTALMIGVVAFIVADTTFALLTLANSYASENPLGLGWPLGIFLMSYAAVKRKAEGASYTVRSDKPLQFLGHSLPSGLAGSYVLYSLVAAVGFLIWIDRI